MHPNNEDKSQCDTKNSSKFLKNILSKTLEIKRIAVKPTVSTLTSHIQVFCEVLYILKVNKMKKHFK